MKKFYLFLLVIIIFASCSTMKPYDSESVKMSMHTILASAKNIGTAVESGDVSQSATDFEMMKNEFHKLAKMEPPKGAADEWKMLHKEMYSLASDGMKASEEGDTAKTGMILGEVFALQKKGHGLYK